MAVGFGIWSACAVLMIGIGAWSRNAKKAAGFWANAEAPEVTDIKNYNRAVSRIWFVSGVLFEMLGLPMLSGGQNNPVVMLSVVGSMFLVIGMMIAYMRVENKYRSK